MASRPTSEQRREFGAFLSSRRARLQPQQFGLPEGPRRTPGLRREEVAVLAGVSVSWYTWLEQGRDIQPSPEALQRIAKVFKLNRVEAAHLFALSSLEPPAIATGGAVSAGLELLVRAIDPIPAYVRNSRLDILAWNDAVAGLFIDYGMLAPHERNTLRLLFLYLPYRSRILDWEQMARGMLCTFRANRAQAQAQGQDQAAPFDSLVEELSGQSPEFRDWWQGSDVKGFDEGRKRLRDANGQTLEFTYVSLTPQGRPDLSLVTYIPRPAARDSRS